MIAFADLSTFEVYTNEVSRPLVRQKSLNLETKYLVWPEPITLLYPLVISDREVLLSCHDLRSVSPFALLFCGEQYQSLFARWYDELWATIPDTHLVYSRNGINERALDLVRSELETLESAGGRQTT